MGPPKATSSRLSKRWRPTPEQVMILKGLFKGGLTTPSAHQIQKITSQLKEYGKVESKNVFYWFQNHKAREKQKLTRKQLLLHNNNNNNNHLLCYVYLPTQQYPSGICPIFPAQAMRDFQWRNLERPEMMATMDNNNSNKEEEEEGEKDGSSSVVNVTWLTTESESSGHHQQSHRKRLKTLQLFPTAASSSSCSSMSS